jgi:hypothetical protein
MATRNATPPTRSVNQIKIEEARKKTLADALAGLGQPEDVPPADSTAIARELKSAAADVKALLAGTTLQSPDQHIRAVRERVCH